MSGVRRNIHLIKPAFILKWNGRLHLFSVSRLETLWLSRGGGAWAWAWAFLKLRSEGVKGFLLHQCLLLHFRSSPGINTGTPPHTCLCVCTHSNKGETVSSIILRQQCWLHTRTQIYCTEFTVCHCVFYSMPQQWQISVIMSLGLAM